MSPSGDGRPAGVRPAKREDREELMHFVSRTWEWGDYVPSVWDEWLGDASGRMFVAEVDGRPVGMNHLRYLEEGVGWLEGVRVHPDYRGRGLATELGKRAIEHAKGLGADRFRLITSASNLSAQKQIARLGLSRKLSFGIFEAKGGSASVACEPAVGGVPDLRSSHLGGFFADRWALRSVREYGVAKLRREGRLFAARRDGSEAFAVADAASFGGERFGQVSLLCGEPDLAADLAASLAARFSGHCYAFCSLGSGSAELLPAKGFGEPDEMLLYGAP
ncbi:MAG: GNAT family N-acetyltransferase [Nitrososphaerota archaeon]|nr:GNAT family N-acetyltransferase [Nitrososphaerota archaeon]MDG6939316.1 GNAT family N-acetyltransferase [Nitrososphaerota archaeon]